MKKQDKNYETHKTIPMTSVEEYPIELSMPSLKSHTGKYYTLEGKEITRSRYSRFISSADEVSPTEIYSLIVENSKLRSKLFRISAIFLEV